MVQYYRIAGLVVQMDTFGRTLKQAEPYLCEKLQPQIDIASDWKALQSRQPHLNRDDSEYISTGSSFYTQLMRYDGLLLHASAVVLDGKAYLFSANSGTGKSTHTQLWLKQFGQRAYILNDDKPALRRENGKWYAYGTPWSGKYDINTNARVPVAGICFLTRAQHNSIRPFKGSKAAYDFLQQTLRPVNAQLRVNLMTLLGLLMEEVPMWQLECNMEPDAVCVSYEAMSGCKMKEALL